MIQEFLAYICRCNRRMTVEEIVKAKYDPEFWRKAVTSWPGVGGRDTSIISTENKEMNSTSNRMSIKNLPDDVKRKMAEYIVFHFDSTTADDVAKKFEVTKEQVTYMVYKLRASGILVPKSLRQNRDTFFNNFLGEFKQKHPELIKQDPPQTGKKWSERTR